MNQKIQKLLFMSILLCFALVSIANSNNCNSCPTGCTTSQNLFQQRPFSSNSARQLILIKDAWSPNIDKDEWFAQPAVGFEYESNRGGNCSNRCCSLGSMPFWSSTLSNTMTLGNNKNGSDFDVYQMGMGPVTTTGHVTLSPIIFQTGADLSLYVGAQRQEPGFFIKIHAPIGVASINPRLSSDNTVSSVAYPAGGLDVLADGTTDAPYATITQAFAGDKSAGFLKPMKYGKITCKQTTGAKFGDVEFTLGYNVIADDVKHLGIGVIATAPTANKATAVHVLQPIFGNNGHWAVGGEVIGHYKCWQSDEQQRYIDVVFDGNIQHLFKSRHMRSFDLAANGKGSKYLLVADYTNNVFQNVIQNAINITTRSVISTFNVVADFTLAFDFHCKNWSAMIGYNGWARSCEKLQLDCKCPSSINLNDYAVLGRQTPFCNNSMSGCSEVGQCRNNLCEPLATIGASQDRDHSCNGPLPTGIAFATDAANRINSDATIALDIQGQRAHAAYTSKPFAQVQYSWTNSEYAPFISVSGGYEFSNRKNSAQNMWSVGLASGFTF